VYYNNTIYISLHYSDIADLLYWAISYCAYCGKHCAVLSFCELDKEAADIVKNRKRVSFLVRHQANFTTVTIKMTSRPMVEIYGSASAASMLGIGYSRAAI
jgi:hypothetical protein